MSNCLVFIRHAEPVKDTSAHPVKWQLSDSGRAQAVGLLERIPWRPVDAIYASEEEKAIQTVMPIAEHFGVKVRTLAAFNEQKRGERFLPEDEFKALKETKLTDLDANPDDGETSREALVRFMHGIKKVEGMHDDKTIVIGSHGTVLSLYFAYLTGELEMAYKRWQYIDFCDIGVVVSGRVVRDIV